MKNRKKRLMKIGAVIAVIAVAGIAGGVVICKGAKSIRADSSRGSNQ